MNDTSRSFISSQRSRGACVATSILFQPCATDFQEGLSRVPPSSAPGRSSQSSNKVRAASTPERRVGLEQAEKVSSISSSALWWWKTRWPTFTWARAWSLIPRQWLSGRKPGTRPQEYSLPQSALRLASARMQDCPRNAVKVWVQPSCAGCRPPFSVPCWRRVTLKFPPSRS